MLNLKRKSLKWALEHINKFNDTYIFPEPFEFQAINFQKDIVLDYLEKIDISTFGIQTYRTEITPKSQVGFRICTQLDPLDSIIYNAVLYEISDDIENIRIDKNKEVVYSFRLKTDDEGILYDRDFNWESFNNKAKQIIDTDEYKYVVITDIADFYPSIYLHNIETCLREAVSKSGKSLHADVLIKLIKAMHVSQTHKGLPVGPQFSRPIAELILHDIDNILINNNIKFIRYVDDYRIFCKSETEAYSNLSFLAQKFYDLRNLKLNEQKTKIMKIEQFEEKYIKVFKDKENDRVMEEFYSLCKELGISTSTYDDIDLSKLTDTQRKELEQLNIMELLKEEIESDNVDLGLVKFLLNNLARFDNTEVSDIILEHIIKIFPIIPTFISYLERVRSFNDNQKHKIGKDILQLFDNSFITELQFNRAYLLNLFTKNEEWNNKDKFIELYRKYNDDMTVRELILCLGRAKNIEYFRENKMINTSQKDPWVRRAFIAAISCLPKDERKAWFNSQQYRHREFLDEIVENWALKNHF